ncbi:MAG: hypothetical protein O2780_00500 [Proteobacteria bacterium]|nr:hypothetical protein [Pseudomonadota bacterium]MDA1300303.1 hypothetical protein [Pseudomonadota bacterium]
MNEGSGEVADFRPVLRAAAPVGCAGLLRLELLVDAAFLVVVLLTGVFVLVASLSGIWLAAACFAGVFLTDAFFTDAFFAGAFFAGVFFTGAFFVAALLAGAFLEVPDFLATALLVVTFLLAFDWVFTAAFLVGLVLLALFASVPTESDLVFGVDLVLADDLVPALLFAGDAFFFAAMLPAVLRMSVKSSGEHYQIISKTQASSGSSDVPGRWYDDRFPAGPEDHNVIRKTTRRYGALQGNEGPAASQ